MKIVDLTPGDEEAIYQAAGLLVEGFKAHWPDAWPDMEAALEEVKESFGGDRINRIAVDNQRKVLGWIGGTRHYHGSAWELHPLVVSAEHQGLGIGRALVADLELLAANRGGVTIFLGTDDEDSMTSLSNIDLYPNVWEHLASIENLGGHPYEFYQKLGYHIVGVIPDANGIGKPDIIMAKRVGK